MRRWQLIVAISLLFAAAEARGDDSSKLFPFVLPWDDASPGVTDVSGWLPKPAGKLGLMHAGDDGHLHTGNERIRFVGVNLAFAANFPRKEDAPRVAGRLAKFGINVVRFHHMDMYAFPQGLRARNAAGTGDLDPEALERLDYFVAQLKSHGIYANLNLLVSRPFNAADGLPADIERIADWKDRHVVGFFHEAALKAQQEYARKLLTHRNPYTELTYAEDPAVAFVEINNENGLLHAWLGGQVDHLPEVFLHDLQRQWNAWLRQRHSSTVKLRQAWGVKEEALGGELLANADFSHGVEHWDLERHEKAEASAAGSDDVPPALRKDSATARSVRVTVTQPGTMSWHVQFNQAGIKVQADHPYTLRFWARAEKPLKLTALVGQAHDPWNDLGLREEVDLTTEWKLFRFVFLPRASDDKARVSFTDLAGQAATVWLAGVSLRPGGAAGLAPGEQIENDALPPFAHARFGERTAPAQRDWLRFLWETEDAYWQAMQRYLKEVLKVRGVVMGTIVGCSTPNLMARFDTVDTHAYWQHPQFPDRPWDPENWVVANRTMVNEAGGTLPGLALRRIAGKPHSVTEYNHPAPNTFAGEGFLLLAAYGALQDWDAIYAFGYSHSGEWNARRITGFFDIDQHPTKMASLPAVAALFLRGDVRPAQKQVTAALGKEREIEALRGSQAWELVHAGTVGVSPETALVHRVALVTEGGKRGEEASGEEVRPGEARYASDTGELLWDLGNRKRGVVTVDTPKSKAVIGYAGGKRFALGGVVIEPGDTVQDGWCIVTLTAMEGSLATGPARLLVTATGLAENTGMKWKSSAKDSVGRDWGKAPSLVEGVPARLTLPFPPARVQAWALDERGQRKAALTVRSVGEDKALLALELEKQTLWYEIDVK
jgi:hypothetical protein